MGGGFGVVMPVRPGVVVGLGSMRIRPGVVVPGGPCMIVRSAPSVIVRIRHGVVVGRMPGCPAGSAIVRMFIAGLTMLMRFFIAGIIPFVGMMA